MHLPIKQIHHLLQDHYPQTSDYDFISNSTCDMVFKDMANSSFFTYPETIFLQSGLFLLSKKSSETQISAYLLYKKSEINLNLNAITELNDAVLKTVIY